LKTIDRIKVDLKSPWKWQTIGRDHIALLVEYYEAAEGELKYLGTSGDTLMYRRLKEARARLEEKDE